MVDHDGLVVEDDSVEGEVLCFEVRPGGKKVVEELANEVVMVVIAEAVNGDEGGDAIEVGFGGLGRWIYRF